MRKRKRKRKRERESEQEQQQTTVGQGWNLVKKANILNVFRMGLPLVENLSWLRGNSFSYLEAPAPYW